jgi:hypothetical protein
MRKHRSFTDVARRGANSVAFGTLVGNTCSLAASNLPIREESRRTVSNFVSKHPGAFALGKSISELAQGCYAYEALSLVAIHPKAQLIVPDVPVGQGAQGKLVRRDGTSHSFDMRHYLNLAKGHAITNQYILRSWYSGALITAGDLLTGHSYFDRQPEFELVYHLRNGAAHGNRFNITSNGEKRLHSYSAYLRWFDNSERFRVDKTLNGSKMLFDFVGPGDVADILTFAAERLKDLERGILGPNVNTSIFG